MPNTTISPNMGLPVPNVGVDPGPDWANNINSSLSILDSHNHTPGSGNPIPVAGLSINADLPLNMNNLVTARSVRFTSQGSPLSLVTDIGCLYEAGVDLYYNDGNGNQIRITQGGSIAGASGTISGLVAPASASYSSGLSTFIFQSDVNKAANLDAGSIVLRNLSTSSFGLTLSPPTLVSDYVITLPLLPAGNRFLAIDNFGNISTSMTSALADSVGVAMTSTGADSIATVMTSSGANTIAEKTTRSAGSPTEGVGGVAITSSSGNFSTTSSVFVQIPNQSISLVTTGRPVMITIQPDGSGNAWLRSPGASGSTFISFLQIKNDTTGASYVYEFEPGISSGSLAVNYPGCITLIDFPAAGTNLYSANLASNGGGFVAVNSIVMTAHEIT